MNPLVAGLRRWARRVRPLRILARRLRATFGPHSRSIRHIQNEWPGALLQPASTTRSNRYPVLFAFVRDRLADVQEPRILSYGCAEGEEVFSLRNYLPDAWITGADINPRSIARARKRLARAADSRIRFQLCRNPEDLDAGGFDAIFCMAVLRHGDLQAEMPESCEGVLPFARVETVVDGLATRLKPGGYLVVWNAHFRFADMAASRDFDAIFEACGGGHINQPLYGPDNRRLADTVYSDAVFRKRP